MKKENLEKSIMLIGPSCVGKSLIAERLSKQLDMPVLSLDDLFAFIDMEQDRILSPNPKNQASYINACLEEIKNDPQMSETLENEEYRQTQIKLVYDFIDLYNYYRHLVGPLSDYYKLNSEYYSTIKNVSTINETTYALKDLSLKVLNKALDKIDKPIIIDPPAPFGWEAKKISFFENFRMNTFASNINPYILDKKIADLSKKTRTILLEPGQDFKLRNAAPSNGNANLIENIEGYFNNADIVISTNDLFYEPNNAWLKQRSWIDAREAKTKARLKNNSEINNICYQITNGLEELSME